MQCLGGNKGNMMLQLEEKLKILNWVELKVCKRRNFVLPSYQKNKNLIKEMKELVEKGRKIIAREKWSIRREKEFK